MGLGNMGIMMGNAAKSGIDTYTTLKSDARQDAADKRAQGLYEAQMAQIKRKQDDEAAIDQAGAMESATTSDTYAQGGKTYTPKEWGLNKANPDFAGPQAEGDPNTGSYEPAVRTVVKPTDAAAKAAGLLRARGLQKEADATVARGREFGVQEAMKPVQEFIQRGGTASEFYDQFLKGHSDAKTNPMQIHPVTQKDGTEAFAVLDRSTNQNKIVGLEDMVHQYAGVLQVTNGNFDKWAAMDATQRKQAIEESKAAGESRKNEAYAGYMEDRTETAQERMKSNKEIQAAHDETRLAVARAAAAAKAAGKGDGSTLAREKYTEAQLRQSIKENNPFYTVTLPSSEKPVELVAPKSLYTSLVRNTEIGPDRAASIMAELHEKVTKLSADEKTGAVNPDLFAKNLNEYSTNMANELRARQKKAAPGSGTPVVSDKPAASPTSATPKQGLSTAPRKAAASTEVPDPPPQTYRTGLTTKPNPAYADWVAKYGDAYAEKAKGAEVAHAAQVKRLQTYNPYQQPKL